MEMRGVEPLSESSKPGLSPSAVCVLTFPPPTSRRQDDGFSSFIKSGRPQSLRQLVPCYYDVDGLRGRTLRVDDRRLSGESYVIVVVSYCFSPLLGGSGSAARFSAPPHPRRNQIRPRVGGFVHDYYTTFPGKYQPLARTARSISRWASRLARSSRLS